MNVDYGIVIQARAQGAPFGGGFGTIRLAEAPRFAYEENRATVQPLLRHPVNINSASEEVLTRIIEGVHYDMFGRNRGTEGRVSSGAAKIVVEGILASRPIQGLKGFRDLLETLVLANPLVFTGFQAEAIFRNAVDANDALLVHSTVPFCFESFDYYTFDASSVVNDQSGRELARSMVRERVHASPSGRLEFLLDSQADFERPLSRVRAGKFVSTFPYPVSRWMSANAQPESRIPRMLWRFGGAAVAAMLGEQEGDKDESGLFEHGVFPHEVEGEIMLMAARMQSPGYNKHFDGPITGMPDEGVSLHQIDPHGWKLSYGPYKMNPRDNSGGFGGGGQAMVARTRTIQGQPGSGGGGQVTVEVRSGGPGGPGGGGRQGRRQSSGALMGQTNPNPLRFDCWYNPGSSFAGRHVLLDYVGEDADQDRIQLVREGDGRLVAKVHDRTLRDQLSNFEDSAIATWTPEFAGFWQPNTWYHLGFAYRGTKPDDLMLFVDGYKRGKSRYLTTLNGSIKDDDVSFTVEDAEDWPERGVVMVGTEVIAFRRSGNSFDVIEEAQPNGGTWRGRGQRGTRARAHPQGTQVELFGYSGLPRTNNGQQGVAIPRGGATLKDPLKHWCVATYQGTHVQSFNVPGAGPGGTPLTVQLEVHDPARPNGHSITLAESSLGPGITDFDAFPKSGGYIVIVSQDVSIPGAPPGGIEFAKYQARAGSELINVQPVPNPPNKALAQTASIPGFANLNLSPISLTRSVHPVRVVNGPMAGRNLSCVFPVSIAITDTAGYRDPEQHRGTGTWDTDPEFVQVGTPDPESLQNNRIEWIRYHHMDKDGGHLLCDEAVYILGAAGVLRAMHLGAGPLFGAHDTLREVFPFRAQGGTAAQGDGDVAAGCDVVPCFRTVAHSERAAINVEGYDPSTNPDAPVNGSGWSFAGWGDTVTIEGQNARDRKSARVAWAGLDGPENYTRDIGGNQVTFPHRPPYPGHGWIAFEESPGAEYRQRSLPRDGLTNARTNYVRLLKFPSGELPEMGRDARAYAGGDADGQVGSADGWIDELRVTAFEPERFVLWNHEEMQFTSPTTQAVARRAGIDDTVDEIPIANVEWVVCNPTAFGPDPRFYILPDGRKINYDQELRGFPQNDAGLVRIGEEIIAFRNIGRSQSGQPVLMDCQRGFMRTTPARHAYGENIVFLDFVSVSMLQGAVDASNPVLAVANTGGFLQNGGTVLVDDEMVHYTELAQGGLSMPWAVNDRGESTGGLFRGRFGTLPHTHDAQAIVMEMPFRYWDRYAPRQDSGELAYYGFSLNLPGAWFESVSFDEYRPNEKVDLSILCRTDPDVAWSADPKRTPGLFEFDEGTENEPAVVHRAGRGLDVRVVFKYLGGAFQTDLSAHEWKSSPVLRSLRVRYLDETRVIGREDVR